MNSINIAMATDDNYVIPTDVAISSIIKNKEKESITLYLFYVNLSVENIKYFKNKYKDAINITIKKVDDNLIPNIETKYVSKSALIRLFLYKYLPNDIEKILWLDGDIIVLKSLKDLFEVEINNNYFIGYKDCKIQKEDYVRLNLNLKYRYINSGIMVMNINRMRKNDYYYTLTNFINNNEYLLSYPDQDIINKIFLERNEILVLEDNNRFNKYVDFIRHKDIKKMNISILHYEGPHNKPWKGRACRHYLLWWKYALKANIKYINEFIRVTPYHLKQLFSKIIHKIEIVIGLRKKNEFYNND